MANLKKSKGTTQREPLGICCGNLVSYQRAVPRDSANEHKTLDPKKTLAIKK